MKSYLLLHIIIAILILLPIKGKCETENNFDSNAVIDSIVIENNNIFDLNSDEFQSWVYRQANKYHIKTRQFVIRRELLQSEGEMFSPLLAEETARNLRSLSYINNAEVELRKGSDNKNVLFVNTSDYWSLTGGVFYFRNSNENTVQLHIEEKNIFGLGQFASLSYTTRDSVRNSIRFDFWERRLLGTRNSLSLFFDENPRIGNKGIRLRRPYFSQNTKTTYSIEYNNLNYDLEYYNEGYETAEADKDAVNF